MHTTTSSTQCFEDTLCAIHTTDRSEPTRPDPAPQVRVDPNRPSRERLRRCVRSVGRSMLGGRQGGRRRAARRLERPAVGISGEGRAAARPPPPPPQPPTVTFSGCRFGMGPLGSAPFSRWARVQRVPGVPAGVHPQVTRTHLAILLAS